MKKINIPSLLESDLAYETGIHIGDGCLSCYGRKNYEICFTGHLIDDLKFYKEILIPLLKKLFDVKPNLKIVKSKNVCRIKFSSKKLFLFKHKVLHLPVGDKNKMSSIPEFIFLNSSNMISFLRGLIDTDGSVKFIAKSKNKRIHYYPQIRIALKNRIIIQQILKILKFLDFQCSFYKESYKDERTKRTYSKWCIDLNGKDNLIKLFEVIKPMNLKHVSKYKIWKKYGFCPPKLNPIQREKIIKNKINPIQFYQGL